MDRRHTLAALPALAAAAAASAPGLADDDPAARIAEAFVYGFAVHDLARTRWNATQNPANPRRATVNAPNHVRRLLDHRARTVTAPNNDTLYTSAWLDLSGGPLTVRVPAMGRRYWSLAFMDPFTDNVACVSRRTSGGDARTLWIAPPGWTGSPPAGATPLRMPANDLWLLGRVLVDGEDDLPAVHALQDAIRIDAPPVSRPWGQAPGERDPRAFVAFVAEALGRNPLPDRDAALLARAATVGLVPGDPGAFDRAGEPVRDAWTRLLPVLRTRLATPEARFTTEVGSGWTSGADTIGRFGDDHAYRAYIALWGLGALEREEAVYARAETDADGRPLDGAADYALRVPADLPVGAFWSLSMYRAEPDGRAFFAENAIGRHTIGDRTPGIVRDADGALTVRLGRRAPADPAGRANWLPAPEGRFLLAWRLYEPGAALLERRWPLPGVLRTG